MATRLFFLLLIISFIILISYYSAVSVSTLHQSISPTFEQYLHAQAEQHSNPSFFCRCSTLAVPYEKFLQVSYIPHPLCFSHLLQILSSAQVQNDLTTLPFDFRFLANAFFLSFDALCQVSVEHISNRLMSFNSSLFVTDTMLAPEIFSSAINEISSTMKLSIVSSFVNPLAMISSTMNNNKLMGTLFTNFVFVFAEVENNLEAHMAVLLFRNHTADDSVYCDCLSNVHCYRSMQIFDLSVDRYWVMDIPSLYSGCSIMEGMNVSSFACLFNQSCFNMMTALLNVTTANVINPNELVSFMTNSTVEEIMNEVFIDQWNFSASHHAFYDQCQPSSCIYTLIQRNSLIIIFTTVLSLLGGLMKILKLAVPHFIQGIFFLYTRCCRPRAERTINTTNSRFNFSLQFVWNKLRQWNYFRSRYPNADDEYEIRNQIIATRLFLVVSALSIVILTIYSSQQPIMKTVTFNNPTVDDYTSLITTESETLTCPCKNIAIRRGDFLTFRPTFHQICQSIFTNPAWSYKLAQIVSNGLLVDVLDFRHSSPVIFQALTTFCRLSKAQIEKDLQNFYRSEFVTTEVLPHKLLTQKGQSLIDLFISVSENEFTNALQITRDMTFTNLLMSGAGVSIKIELHHLNETYQQIRSSSFVLHNPFSSSDCTCDASDSCVEQAAIYEHSDNQTMSYDIPGFFVGCQIVDTTLKSNFHILYNQSWIDEYRARIGFDDVNPDPFSTIALNVSIRSQFNMTTPIQMIIEKMMVEDWHSFTNFSAYYDQCHPVKCEYSYVVKYDIIYIITTIIGLMGGLLTIFQFLIPLLVKLIRKYCFKQRRQITVEVIATSTISKHG